jgi:hypothetical protein
MYREDIESPNALARFLVDGTPLDIGLAYHDVRVCFYEMAPIPRIPAHDEYEEDPDAPEVPVFVYGDFAMARPARLVHVEEVPEGPVTLREIYHNHNNVFLELVVSSPATHPLGGVAQSPIWQYGIIKHTDGVSDIVRTKTGRSVEILIDDVVGDSGTVGQWARFPNIIRKASGMAGLVFAHPIIYEDIRQWYREHEASRKIQRAWLDASSDPYHPMGRRCTLRRAGFDPSECHDLVKNGLSGSPRGSLV